MTSHNVRDCFLDGSDCGCSTCPVAKQKYRVSYSVTYETELMAESEQDAIEKALALGEDAFDGGRTSQYEAEEI